MVMTHTEAVTASGCPRNQGQPWLSPSWRMSSGERKGGKRAGKALAGEQDLCTTENERLGPSAAKADAVRERAKKQACCSQSWRWIGHWQRKRTRKIRSGWLLEGRPRTPGGEGAGGAHGRTDWQRGPHPHAVLWWQTQNGWIWVRKNSRYHFLPFWVKRRRTFIYLWTSVAQERKWWALESRRRTSCLWNWRVTEALWPRLSLQRGLTSASFMDRLGDEVKGPT